MPENKTMTRSLSYFYTKKLGAPPRRVITTPIVTAVAGKYMDTPMSKLHIRRFVRKNELDLSEYCHEKYGCFNDFFTRQIKPEARPVDMRPEKLISPCDGHLSAYRIDSDSVFNIKDSYYRVSDLVNSRFIADEYLDGYCLVFRLGVENYHRYCYIDNGTKSVNFRIRGRYNPVQPIVVNNHPVFTQNTREYTIMQTENFGTVVQIEVGACLVGKIINHREAGRIYKGTEKGMFQFGGSTIVLLMKKDSVKLPERYFVATSQGTETDVKYGQAIGEKA